jgi:4-carboxymuconolactone decarboxylase
MTKGIFDNSLKYHLSNAKNHGVTAEEMVEIITQAALYAGWPNAWAVFPLAKEVYSEDDTG